MNSFKILLIVLMATNSLFSQKQETEAVWRINILNPGVEYEIPTNKTSTFSVGIGVGYSVYYPHSDAVTGGAGLLNITRFNPFLDLQHKWFYNFDKREAKGLNTVKNSGNFISARFLVRSEQLFDDNNSKGTDFAIGPTWGIQRAYGKRFHFLFDMGPIYYFDTNGKGNFFPLIVQLNFGINL